MPGMTSHPVSLTNPWVVSSFHHDLFGTSLIWLAGIAAALLLAGVLSRRIFTFNMSSAGLAEPRARTYLRWTFGALWLFDGVLQFQPSMPLGLGSVVVYPAAHGTPPWLRHLMLHGVNLWYNHPIALAVGVAWLQIGLGLALLTSNGVVGRVAGLVSAGWGALIWLIGNGAGGVFIRGASILFGWPGATLFYVIAGLWIAAPVDLFARRFSTVTLRIVAVVVALAIVVQSLPAAEFWHGGRTNALAAMTSYMTGVPQPHWLAWLVLRGGDLGALMGGGLNVAVIVWLGVTAVGLWLSATRAWRWPVVSLAVGAVVFWIIGEDTAVFGGMATDVNSLLPLAALAACAAPAWRGAGARTRRLAREAGAGIGSVVATFATAMVAFAVASMGVAMASPAENTVYIAQNGPVSPANTPAARFTLTDQYHQTYSLLEHPGRTTVLAFLDPVCWTDCPLIAAQLKLLRAQLGPRAPVDIVAVAIDPYHEKVSDLRHFMTKHDLWGVRDFYYVTGRLATLRRVWNAYGISVTMTRTDKMSVHSDFDFIVSSSGMLRWIIPDDPPASAAGTASAASQLRQLLSGLGVT